MLIGIDASHYQSGLDMVQAAREGIAFVIGKVSQGSGSRDAAWPSHRDNARRAGLIVAGYHYVDGSDPAAQARNCLANLGDRSVPVSLDCEAGSGDVGHHRAVLAEFARAGIRVPMHYCPRFYWAQIGSPSLAGFPPLWAARYPTTSPGSPGALLARVPASYWNGHGGLPVAMIQFSEAATVAGHSVDADAYPGTADQLHALLYGDAAPAVPQVAPPAPVAEEDQQMDGRTAMPPVDKNGTPTTPKHDWPRDYRVLGFVPGQQPKLHWGGGGGWIHSAQFWVRDPNLWTANVPKHFPVPVNVGPNGTERFSGFAWEPTAPAGADELEITFSAPYGFHFFAH